MNELANQYATALFELLEDAEKPLVLSELSSVSETLAASKELRTVLCSPSFDYEEKEKAIRTIFVSLESVPHLLPFLLLVAKNHRYEIFEDIVSSFRSLVNQEAGVEEGILYTAFSLKDEEVANIEGALSKRLGAKVALRVVLDPHLIGGIKVAIAGKVFDGSIKNRLAELRAQLKSGGNA